MTEIPHWADRLQQTQYWWNKAGTRIDVATAPADYRRDILHWVHEHATRIVDTVVWYYLFQPSPRSEVALDVFDNELDRMQETPWEWLRGTPLVLAVADEDLHEYLRRLGPVSRLGSTEAPSTAELAAARPKAGGRHSQTDVDRDGAFEALVELTTTADTDPEWSGYLRTAFGVEGDDEVDWAEVLKEVLG